ncbi:MAG: hypothetical protein ACTSWC_11555 [Promethearchaeota archaeon]
MKFRSDIYLGLFFAICGWIYPALFFYPFSESSALFYTYWANFLIPLNTCFLTFFLDKIVFDRLRIPSFIYTILSGISLGLYLTTEGIKIRPVQSAYGIFYTAIFEGLYVQIFLYITYLMIFALILRFFYLGYKFYRLHLPYVRNFFIIMGSGYFFWLFLNILKRIFPYYLYGLDFLMISLAYMLIMIGYFKNRNQLTILPGNLRFLIFEAKNSANYHIYDFSSSNFIQSSEISPQLSTIKLLYDTLKGTEIIFKEKLESIAPVSFVDVNFQKLWVTNYQSEYYHWSVFSVKPSQIYQQVLSRAISEFESQITQNSNSLDLKDDQVTLILKQILSPIY